MPNWVRNEVVITGNRKTIQALRDFLGKEDFLGGKQDISFANIFIPKEMDEYKKSLEEPGVSPYWYEWNCANWGTKWNACDVNLEQTEAYATLDGKPVTLSLCYTFDTAWSPPSRVLEWFVDFATQFDCLLAWKYQEEQGWGGIVRVEDGEADEETWDIPSTHEESERILGYCWCDGEDDKPYFDCP